ncbi:GNAT family N-acetyltransferase [Croceiramulus getboli]|nr:GNAT family N-acetyltransferase [Flavobacteriaceae bacterium YJPT1-3]
MHIEHKQNDRRGLFFIEGDQGIISQLTYDKKGDHLVIDHTETIRPEESKGYASKLVKHVVDYAREHNFTIDPLCPFAEVQFDQNPSYADVRAS